MAMVLSANWSYPTDIWFGAGRVKELAAACQQAGIRKPLLVSDRVLAQLPMCAQAQELLQDAGLEHALFSEVDANPSDSNMQLGIAAYKQGQHDGVVAFGGGSALDLGKAIAFMADQERPVWDFEDIADWWQRANSSAIAPTVALPTTAGTGSEVGRACVITNSAEQVKKIIFHPQMLPRVVICDPQLTLSLPAPITAATGMDALSHCIEAYCARAYHPLSHGIALEGMRLIKDNLLRAYTHGDDLTARTHMMSAAAMGTIALQKGLGAVHAISHPVGALYATHHGLTNAVVLPAVLRFNKPAIGASLAAAAAYLGIAGGFEGFYQYIVELRRQLAIPANLAELGVKSAAIEQLSTMALADPSAAGNPIGLNEGNITELIAECIDGA